MTFLLAAEALLLRVYLCFTVYDVVIWLIFLSTLQHITPVCKHDIQGAERR